MVSPGDLRITVFPGLRVVVDGRDVTAALPGRQGRALLACLAVRHPEAVHRDELLQVLWPRKLPVAPDADFRSVLAKVRRVLWPEAIVGRELLALQVPEAAAFDARDAVRLTAAAEQALRAGDAHAALTAAEQAVATFSRPLLSGADGEWLDGPRRFVEEQLRLALELAARAGLAAGGDHLARAERAAKALVARDRFREHSHELLMRAQAGRGDVSEALRTYEALRVLLRDELGTRPSAGLIELHDRLLLDGEPRLEPTAASPVDLPVVTPRVSLGAFVGREPALERLLAAWSEACSGPTGVVLVEGPAGIGKTRLAARFADEVHGGGGTVLYGRADEEAFTTFQPFVEALRHLLTRGGESFAGETARERAVLARLLPDLGPATDDVTAEVGEAQRYRLFEGVAALLARATRRWPVLLVLDDLHWADRPTLLLLRHLLRHPDLGRLLIVGTFRPVPGDAGDPLADLLRALRRDRRYEHIGLDGLDVAATAALVEDRLGRTPAPGLIERLHEQTGGNAFFLEETVRALIDSDGDLSEATLEQIGVPEGVVAVILRHVKGLSPFAADVLTAASVIGRDFTLDVLALAVPASTDDTLSALDEGLAARLIEEARDEPDRFAFVHAVVRRALYQQLNGARRTRLHLRVAEALEDARTEAGLNPGELARHYDLARHLVGPGPALRYSILAGRRAAALFDYGEAMGHFQRALALLDPAEDDRRAELLLALGRVQYHGSDRRARETFLAAAEIARAQGDAEQLARAALGLGERYWETAYVGSRFGELLEEAAERLGPVDSPLRALVLARLAENLAFPAHHERAPALSAEALAIARRLDDEDVLTQALLARHVTSLDVDDLDERLDLMDELLQRVGDHRELSAERHQWRLYDLLEAGDVEAAREDHRLLEAMAAELRQPLFQTLAVGWRGVLAELAGEVAVAEECADECRRFGERAHARDAESTWAAKMFALRRREGRLDELEAITEQLALERRPGWLPALGILRAELGDRAVAARVLDRAWAEGPVPRGMFRLVTLALMADLHALLGRPSPELYAELEPYAHRCVVIGYSSCWGPVDRFLALLAQAAGDTATAERHARAAIARARAMGAPLLVADVERRHQLVG